MVPNAYLDGEPLHEHVSEQKFEEVQEVGGAEASELSANPCCPPIDPTGPTGGGTREHTKKGRAVLDDPEFDSWLRDRSRTFKQTAARFGMTIGMVSYAAKKRGLARGTGGSAHGQALAPLPKLKSRPFGDFTIVKGIPLPPRNNPVSKYEVIARLERDESVLFPDAKPGLISGAAKKFKAKFPEREFATRKAEGGARVWRIA